MSMTPPDPADVHTGTDRVELAALLADHQYDKGFRDMRSRCSCGWSEVTDYRIITHRDHIAEVVADSDWLRGVRAKELRDAAQRYIERGVMPGSPSNVSLWLIDRADRVDAKDGGR